MFGALVGAASAHICIIDPLQRGNFSVAIPGEPPCYRRTAYCGGEAPGPITSVWVAGNKVTIRAHQNLNHWYAGKPGHFELAFNPLPDASGEWQTLATFDDFPAFDMVFSTNLTLTVTAPSTPTPHGVLQFKYTSYNPLEVDPSTNTDAIFYNCADVAILEAPSPISSRPPPPVVRRKRKAEAAAGDCATPQRWWAMATATSALGVVSQHTIYYDSVAQAVAWRRAGGGGMAGLSVWTNYTATPLIEYVVDETARVCDKYGPDGWYPWGYGAAFSMDYAGDVPGSGGRQRMYTSTAPGVGYVAQVLDTAVCAPAVHTMGDYTLSFTAVFPGDLPPMSLVPPPYCFTPEVDAKPVKSCRGPRAW